MPASRRAASRLTEPSAAKGVTIAVSSVPSGADTIMTILPLPRLISCPMPGMVEQIHIAAEEAGRPTRVDSVVVHTGRGLEGDRYLAPADTWAPRGTAITLIEAEAIESVIAEHGIDMRDGRSRRQVTTRGIALNDLVGREFHVGAVRCRGYELCEPCRHLEGMTEPGVIKAFVHRGGLRADVLDGGTIAVGDAIAAG